MTSREVIHIRSDVSGEVAHETVAFSIDGGWYDVDVTTAEATALRDAFSKYIVVARTTRPGAAADRSARRAGPVTDYNPRAVRAWAAERGIDVSDRGRLSKVVLDLYRRTER